MEKVTVNELFSGIGAQRKALENIGVPHEIVGISDIDKYANQSYEAIFGITKNYGDISKVERLDYADLWTYSFPCQDISVAGKQSGVSNTQLYRQAGNSIVVNVLEKIFKNLLIE